MADSTWYVDEEKLSYTMMVLLHEITIQKEQKGKELSFESGFLEKKEGYKYKIYDRARAELAVETWTEEMIGTGEISEKVLNAFKKGGKLVSFSSKAFMERVDTGVAIADRLFYDLFRGDDDEDVFAQYTEIFGSRYDRASYLFFLKDSEKYLPVKPMLFKTYFQWMGIETECTAGLTWEHYMEFLGIMEAMRQRMQVFFAEPLRLLDAHSLISCMYLLEEQITLGRVAYTDYANGKIILTQEQWMSFLNDETVFKASSIEVLQKLYLSPNHASTCKKMAKEDQRDPSAYISPVVAPAKHIMNRLGLEPLKKESNENMYWPVLFLGRDMPDGLFEWKLRPELAAAMEMVFAEELALKMEQEDALHISDEELYSRAKDNSKRTRTRKIITDEKGSNPMVQEFAKRVAKGQCLLCEVEAPFTDKKGRPYLEVHHLRPLAEGGIDSIWNVVALCPNCHRRVHLNGDANSRRNDRELLSQKAATLVEIQKKKYE